MAANTKSTTTSTKTKTTTKTATQRKPADQALQVVDVAVGAPAVAVDNAKRTVDQLRDSQGRTQEIELLQNRVNNLRDRVVEEARKARERVEPVYKDRVEPVVKERVEPVYKQRVEPTVKKVRERTF